MWPNEASWELAEGDEIAPGRSVLKLLGGGRRYEAYLVWDERHARGDGGEDDAARSG